MMLSGMLQWGVRQSAEVESHMTSVERIVEYSNLPPETVERQVELSKTHCRNGFKIKDFNAY